MKDNEVGAVLSGRLLSADNEKTLGFLRNSSKAKIVYEHLVVKNKDCDVLKFYGKEGQVIRAIELCAEYDLFEPKYMVPHASNPRVKRIMKTVKDRRLSEMLKEEGVLSCFGKFGFRHITPKTVKDQQLADVLMIKRCIVCELRSECANAKLIEQNEEVKGYLARSIPKEG